MKKNLFSLIYVGLVSVFFYLFAVRGIPFELVLPGVSQAQGRFVFITGSRTLTQFSKYAGQAAILCHQKKYCVETETTQIVGPNTPIFYTPCSLGEVEEVAQCFDPKLVLIMNTNEWIQATLRR